MESNTTQVKLSTELIERGLVYQYSTESLSEILDGPKKTAYIGIDVTAASPTIGNLVTYIVCHHLLAHGHKVVLLIGNATTMIGDPSFKDEERPNIDEGTIMSNTENMTNIVKALFPDHTLPVVHNYDWFENMPVIEFLKNVGKNFTVNAMIKKDSVKTRLESENGLSFTEFSYSLIQAYDYLHLNVIHGCDLQVGGSDQWGNIVAGIDLIRKKTGNTVHGITIPLIIDKVSGKKFGKSEGNAVWIDGTMTSPYQFYQFWLNTDDVNAIDYIKLYTFLPLEEIANLEQESQKAPEKRILQHKLAGEITKFVHGEQALLDVMKVTSVLFGTDKISEVSEDVKEILKKEAPTYELPEDQTIIDVLTGSGLASSNREAKEFVAGNAVTFNGEVVSDTNYLIQKSDNNDMAILKRGKKNVVVVLL